MGLKPICTESVAHFSHRVRHLRLNRKNYGVTMSETKWLGVAARHSNKRLRTTRSRRGWGWVLRWCGVPHCPCALFGSQVFLAASVLRSTHAFAGLSRGHCVEIYTSSQSVCDGRLFPHVSDLTCLTVRLLSSSVGAPFYFLWFILHCWGRDAILVSGHA